MERPTVLVVEDERSVADAVAYALETDGCVVLRATTGDAAREVLRSRPVALVVLDVGLPDVNGLDLCREIRSRHEVPVIFLTARSDEVDRIVGLEIGADDYVAKPFSPRELSARVRAVLRRTGPAAGLAETASRSTSRAAAQDAAVPIEVDAGRHTIRYFGQLLVLTRAEFRLLELLSRHPGRVYSREQVLGYVWEDSGASTDRSVDSHVKALRAKLRAVRKDLEAIETHRGVGYSLREQW